MKEGAAPPPQRPVREPSSAGQRASERARACHRPARRPRRRRGDAERRWRRMGRSPGRGAALDACHHGRRRRQSDTAGLNPQTPSLSPKLPAPCGRTFRRRSRPSWARLPLRFECPRAWSSRSRTTSRAGFFPRGQCDALTGAVRDDRIAHADPRPSPPAVGTASVSSSPRRYAMNPKTSPPFVSPIKAPTAYPRGCHPLPGRAPPELSKARAALRPIGHGGTPADV